MDKLKLLEAMNMIDDDLVKGTEKLSGAVPETENEAHTEHELTVSGVEIYRRRGWQRFAAIASALVLAVGLTFAGGHYLKSRKPSSDDKKASESEALAPTADNESSSASTTADEKSTETTVTTSAASLNGENEVTEELTTTAATTLSSENEVPTDTSANTDKTTTSAEKTTSRHPETTSKTTSERSTAPITTTQTTTATDFITTTFAPQELTTSNTGTAKAVTDPNGAVTVNIDKGAVFTWFTEANYCGSITLADFPEYLIDYDPGKGTLCYYHKGKRTDIVNGFAEMTFSAYFTDLNCDGHPELCASVEGGSGISYQFLVVYDFMTEKKYTLSDPHYYNYKFITEKGSLYILERSYGSSWSEAKKYEPAISGSTIKCLVPTGFSREASRADINRDGFVTAKDFIALMDYIASQAEASDNDEYIEKRGDIDGNGAVTAKDASMLAVFLSKNANPGDINEDGFINSSDEEYLRYYIENYDLFNHRLTAEQRLQMVRCTTYGDLNKDGNVDAADLDVFEALISS